MMQKINKEDMLAELEMLKSNEEAAEQLYLQVANDIDNNDNTYRQIFEGIAKDEARHSRVVQNIIDIVERLP